MQCIFSAFSVDLRNGTSNRKVWSSPDVFNDRATFRMAGSIRLVINNVNMDDESMYRCRLDFKNSPTKNMKINLTVIGESTTYNIYTYVYYNNKAPLPYTLVFNTEL